MKWLVIRLMLRYCTSPSGADFRGVGPVMVVLMFFSGVSPLLLQITSKFDGVIKKLHHEPEDVVQVGQVCCSSFLSL